MCHYVRNWFFLVMAVGLIDIYTKWITKPAKICLVTKLKFFIHSFIIILPKFGVGRLYIGFGFFIALFCFESQKLICSNNFFKLFTIFFVFISIGMILK